MFFEYYVCSLSIICQCSISIAVSYCYNHFLKHLMNVEDSLIPNIILDCLVNFFFTFHEYYFWTLRLFQNDFGVFIQNYVWTFYKSYLPMFNKHCYLFIVKPIFKTFNECWKIVYCQRFICNIYEIFYWNIQWLFFFNVLRILLLNV